MYLLDTNVISEMRKAGSSRIDPNVAAWANSVPAELLNLSSITVLEIQFGILQLERRDPAQAAIFRAWLTGHILFSFADRILSFDTQAALRCAALHVPNPRPDRDSFIVATALAHGMTLVTRNEADFRDTGVLLLNPWKIPCA